MENARKPLFQVVMSNQEPEKSPFLQLEMGGYTLHPRLRSLIVAQKDEKEDPVNQHIVAAEAIFREGFQVRTI